MIILTIRTDKPEAEVGLYTDNKELAYETWQAHRALAETLLSKIAETLAAQKLSLKDVAGIACYKGPGSFTGLRIGLTVGNALAYGLRLPIVSETGHNWRQTAVRRLLSGEKEPIALPEYGADIHITLPKH